jgi:hypothetical protein
LERTRALIEIIETVTGREQKRECHVYSDTCFRAAREAGDVSDSQREALFALLGRVTFLSLRADSATTPFSPMPSGPLKSEAPMSLQVIIDDEDIDLLAAAPPSIEDVELQARVADVLWVIRRNVEFARAAISAYLASARRLEHPEHWTQCESRLQRALKLALLIGKGPEELDQVVSHIEALLAKYDGEDPLFLSQKLMAQLLYAKRGDPKKYAALSERMAERAEDGQVYFRARAYWETAAEWHKRKRDSPARHRAMVRVAETYVKEADAAIARPGQGYIAASSHLQSAILAYRRIGGEKARATELHAQLLEFQAKSVKELRPVSTEINLSESVSRSIARVTGKPLADALIELAVMVPSPHPDKLEKQAKESAKKFPLQHLFGGVVVNEKGKVVARRPTMLSTGLEAEEALRVSMNQIADYHRFIYAQGVIEPARHQILLEHNVQVTDFVPFVSQNPFVPQGREYIFAQGLHAALEGDYCVAMHLLIPQIENSIRHILSNAGVLTSGLDDEGIQDERSLNTTIYHEAIEAILGKALTFDLRSLLVERTGANLRNRTAHGLMSHNSFYSIHAPYLWSLVLRLCMVPKIRAMYPVKTAREAEAADLLEDD